MKCVRCGQEANQYGTDGMPYCDSCIFYGSNAQCQKCGMYLPRLELQTYQGQWYCPYCIMDLREQNEPKIEKEKKLQEQSIKGERCDRCGRQLSEAVYFFQGKKLCEVCLNQEKPADDGPYSPPITKLIIKQPQEPVYAPLIPMAKPVSLFAASFWEWILIKLGLRKKKDYLEIVPVKKEEQKQRKKKDWSAHKKESKTIMKK